MRLALYLVFAPIVRIRWALHDLSENSPQKPQRLRGYLIRLTREYTDGGMDSRAEYEKGVTHRNMGVYCYHEKSVVFCNSPDDRTVLRKD